MTAQTYGGRDRAASPGGDAPALPSISNPNSSSHCSPGPKQYNFSLVFVKIKQTKSSHCRSPFVWVAIPKSHFFFGFFLCFRTQKCLYTPCIKHQQNHEIDLRILVTGKPKRAPRSLNTWVRSSQPVLPKPVDGFCALKSCKASLKKQTKKKPQTHLFWSICCKY